MDILEPFFGIAIRDWLLACGIAAGIFILLKTLQRVIVSRLSRIAKTTETALDDLVIDVASRTKSIFILMISIYAGSKSLDLPETASRILGVIALLSAIFQGGIWVSGAIIFMVRKKTE